jgi:DUF4097 and DUF4098 domain-containing protein YvlB
MLGACALVGASPLAGQEEVTEWSGRVAAGDFLEVRGISGDIRATLASGGTAEVTAEKRGRTRDFDEVEIRVEEVRGGVIVCAVYRPRTGDSGCDHRDRDWDDDRDRGQRSINVSVDFEVRVPEGVEFIGGMVSGDVEADGLRSDVDASTVSGSVFVSTTGVGRGSTVSGEIEIEMQSADWDELHYSTVSGDITVWMPDGVDTEIDFESLSGDFRSDFDLSVHRSRDRFIGSEFSGRLGDGGRELSFNTVSGDVRLRRLRD